MPTVCPSQLLRGESRANPVWQLGGLCSHPGDHPQTVCRYCSFPDRRSCPARCSPAEPLPSVRARCPSLLLPSVTVRSHLLPACLQCAPYPGSISRDPKELLIAACLLNLGCSDRSVAGDARNKQAGATTPLRPLPTPGLMIPGSLCLCPASPHVEI